MPRRKKPGRSTTRNTKGARAQLPGVMADAEASLLDVVDHVLNKGIVLNGDLVLGVANVDLIYARLSVLLSALDKIGSDQIFRPVKSGGRKRGPRR